MTTRHSVVIVGPLHVEAVETSYARAFEARQWHVHRWTPAEALSAVARGGRAGRVFARFVHLEAWERKANLDLLRVVDEIRPRLVLVIDTTGVRAGTLGQIRARCPGTAIYCVFPDSPHNLGVERIVALPMFDRVGTSSPAWVDVFERLGSRRTAYLPFAADPQLLAPGVPTAQHRSDICFVGTWRPDREEFLERFADLDLRIWGSDYWKTRTRRGSPLKKRWAGRRLRASELGDVAASTKIMLNVVDPPTWPGPNMRAFELAACGAFSLTTRSPALLEIFTEGESVACFDTADEAREVADRYLRDEAARQSIARAAREIVLAGHTWAHRVDTLVEWLAEDRSPSRGIARAAPVPR